MDASPIPGFITRKQAAEKCKRVERTLQRYWSKAIELRDDSVLTHLKLRKEDGDVIEGTDVTKALIEKLKKQRQNPTWYVHASWVESTYGPRREKRAAKKETTSETDESGGEVRPRKSNSELVSVLTQQITDLKKDKVRLEEEKKKDKEHHREDFRMLKEMFDTLKEDHEGTKKLLSKALDVGVEKLRREGEQEPPPSEADPTKKRQRQTAVVDVNEKTFLERHLPTLSKPFRRK